MSNQPTGAASRRAQKLVRSIGLPVGAVAAVGILLTLVINLFKIPDYIIPLPVDILADTVNEFPYLMEHAWVTLQEALVGFSTAIVVAFIVSISMVWSKTVRETIMPLLIFLQTFPKTAVAPLFLIWFGFGIMPKVAVSFLICFFPIVINTTVGLASVDADMLDLGKSMSATKRQIFTKVRIPHSLPYFFTGLRVAITLALVGAIVGEFVGANAGLGHLILIANVRLDTTFLFAIILILIFMGAGLFYSISGLERFLMPWKPAGEESGTTLTGETG